jgi:hypothetical protein
MGLDIFAAGNLKRVGDIDWDDEGINISHDEFDYCDLEEGRYEFNGEYYSFRAGSYSGYNEFRKLLSLSANGISDSDVWESPDSSSALPFYYLINFSDCEGTIGPSIAELLWDQFTTHRSRVISNITDEPDLGKETDDPIAFETEFGIEFGLSPEEIEDFIQVYDDFTEACRVAKDNGIIRFC